MSVPSDIEPDRGDLPVIDHDAARELFRASESSGLGRPGTDDIFDEWLRAYGGIAFYRNADRPVQARPITSSDEIPEWLNNSRLGRGRLVAVFITWSGPAPAQGEEPSEAPTETDEEVDEIYDEADDVDTCTCDGMPGLCLSCEPPEPRYAKLDRRHYRDEEDEDYEDDDEVDQDVDPRVLKLVNAYAGGMVEDPAFDLSGELPPDFNPYKIPALTLLTEVAQRKLDTERWDTDGPWHLVWSSCETDVTNPAWEGEDFSPSDDDLDEESDAIHCHASIANDDDAPNLQIIGTRCGEQHVMYDEPVSRPGDESLDIGTVEGLRDFLQRATDRVGEAGYEMDGEWSVDWWRCHVRLAALDY
ncbi:hypothetical protein ACWCYL_35705 [Streptomyces sp. 900105755]